VVSEASICCDGQDLRLGTASEHEIDSWNIDECSEIHFLDCSPSTSLRPSHTSHKEGNKSSGA